MARSSRHCLDLVRKYDFENYLCNLLLPSESVRSAFAIRAFNVTLAQVRDVASDSRTQQFRYAFWQDAIRALHTHRKELPKGELGEGERFSALKAFRSPVFDELCSAVTRHNLSIKWLSRLVDARASTQARADVFTRLGDLERYADETTCCVLWLLLESVGVRNVLCDHIASHVGKAQTLALHVRSLPYNVMRHGDAAIPHELLAKHGVSLRDLGRVARVYRAPTDASKLNSQNTEQSSRTTAKQRTTDARGPSTQTTLSESAAKSDHSGRQQDSTDKQEAVFNLVHEMASHAEEHIRVARCLFETGSHSRPPSTSPSAATTRHVKPFDALPVFLASLPTASYLSRLEKANFNVFNERLARRDGLLPVRLLIAKYRRRF